MSNLQELRKLAIQSLQRNTPDGMQTASVGNKGSESESESIEPMKIEDDDEFAPPSTKDISQTQPTRASIDRSEADVRKSGSLLFDFFVDRDATSTGTHWRGFSLF